MKTYLVMECHLSYAVVLDQDGRFLKVANRHYEVGQTVTEIVEMAVSQPHQGSAKKWFGSLSALAACLILLFTSLLHLEHLPYASVYMTINPEVRVDVNRRDHVVGLEALNADGEALIAGYDYRQKELEPVMDALVDRAIAMGYLHEGGQITLVLDADSDDWVVAHRAALPEQLNRHLEEAISVTITVKDPGAHIDSVVIPIPPAAPTYSESDYGEPETAEPPPPEPEQAQPPLPDGQQAPAKSGDYGSSFYAPQEQSSDYDDDDFDDGMSDYGFDDDDLDEGLSDYGSDDDDSSSDYDADDD